jgi:hypothetical protein
MSIVSGFLKTGCLFVLRWKGEQRNDPSLFNASEKKKKKETHFAKGYIVVRSRRTFQTPANIVAVFAKKKKATL